MQLQRNIADFVYMMSSVEAMPDVAGGIKFMAIFLKLGGWATIILGIAAFVFLVLRVAVEIFLIAGGDAFLQSFFGGKRTDKFNKFVIGLASWKEGEDTANPRPETPLEYVKTYVWRHVLMLVFVGIMASGAMLPIAGNVMEAMGVVVIKGANVNISGALEHTFKLIEDAPKTLKNASGKMIQSTYTASISNMKRAEEDIRRNYNSDDNTLEQYYYNYGLAYAYTAALAKYIDEAKKDDDLTEVLAIKGLNTRAHESALNKQYWKKAFEIHQKAGTSEGHYPQFESYYNFNGQYANSVKMTYSMDGASAEIAQ